jgi:hypothetical protein
MNRKRKCGGEERGRTMKERNQTRVQYIIYGNVTMKPLYNYHMLIKMFLRKHGIYTMKFYSAIKKNKIRWTLMAHACNPS